MFISPLLRINLRPKLGLWMKQARTLRPVVKIDKERFQISVDVHQFTKDELRVKARSEYVVVEGKQERKTKSGCIVRQFVRKFKLPKGCDVKSIKSELSKDGYLTITAPRQSCDINLPCETVIQIHPLDEIKDESTDSNKPGDRKNS